MSGPLAYRNGKLIPAAELSVPVYDAGFVLGTTVTEQLRTFAGKLFRLEEHLDRLESSLAIVGVDPGFSRAELAAMAHDLVQRNHPLLRAGEDLGLCLFVTPGPYGTMRPHDAELRPLVALHTYPLPFGLFAAHYESGQALATPTVRQMSPRVFPPELKCRSRMHYFLADKQAREIDREARAVMLDDAGHVLEATTANLLMVSRDGTLVSPPREKILPGITVAVTLELASKLGVANCERDLRPEDLHAAAEVLLMSTSVCVLPVVRFDGKNIGDGQPGPMYRQLLAAWSELVGVDVAAQARRFANKS